MADRYPLVVNPTTNQITEIQINDDLQLDDTELTTSTGDLLLNPAGEINCMKSLSNSGGDVIINDSLKVTSPVGIQTNAVSTKSLAIGTTWNGASTAYHGIQLNITNTAADAASRLVELNVGGTKVFDIDVSGDTACNGITADGNALFNGDITLNADNKNFKIQLDNGTDKFTVASATGNTAIVGNLDVDGNTTLDLVTIAETLTLSSGLDANSTANFQGTVTFQSSIVPSGSISLGTSAAPWASAHIGNITIANGTTGTDDETITTVNSKDLYLTSATGLVKITGKIEATSADQDGNFRLISTDAGAAAGPDLVLFRNSASPADGDDLGSIRFTGNDDASTSAETLYARMYAEAVDVSDGSPDGKIIFDVISNNTNTEAMTIDGTGVEISGNLTVQGTTTTINTATLKVEDNVIELRKGNSLAAADGGIQVNLTTNSSGVVQTSRTLKWNNDAAKQYWQVTAKDGNDYAILTEGLPIKVISTIEDVDLNSGTAASGTINYDVKGRNVHHFAQADATADFTLNVREDSTTNFSNHIAGGEAVTISFVYRNGATARKLVALTIDSVAQTVRYANATTPTPPANQRFIYTFTIFRLPDSGGNPVYDVYGTGTAYA
tara:strand:+ start:16658 stop:18496 length:1839 start_codon:yes stop_codon:yes gene_type:complete